MKTYLKIFLATGIPFGIVTGIFYGFQFGFFSSLVGGLIGAIIFGGLMSLVLGFLHRWSVKQIASDKSEAAMGIYQVRNIELWLPYNRAFTLCIRSLDSIKKCKIHREDRSLGKIAAKTGMTWKTFGDVISFEVFSIDDDRTHIKILSRPLVRTTLVDYGKNLENVETIVRIIKQHGNVVVE